MKIGNPSDKPAAPPAAHGTANSAGTTPGTAAAAGAETHKTHVAATPATPDASAKIELSSTAASLLSSGGAAEFDAAKVARITQAISDGSFRINPEVIADKLISNASELLTRAPH